MIEISQLYVYPVKSLGGIKVTSANITSRGFEFDRRWMLIDQNNRFISQRELAKMALLATCMDETGLKVTDTTSGSHILIPFLPETRQFLDVIIWDDTCTGQLVSADADKWFTETLGIASRLVYMPDDSERPTDPAYTPGGAINSFSDAFPFLMIGQAALDDLNIRMNTPIPIDRFRPNIVFTGGTPNLEDTMNEILVGDIAFYGVKLCGRCNVPAIDQRTAAKGKEPTKTLSKYRSKNNGIYFGQNLISGNSGSIAVGDKIVILSTHTEERFTMFV